MNDLIAALKIFLKYVEPGSYHEQYPTNCSHDTLWVNVDPADVSEKDKRKLKALSFIPSEEYEGGFVSFRFGSC